MNVYDFDKTIYAGDSTKDFYIFCLRRHPSILFCLPNQILAVIKYKAKIIDKTSLKEQFYYFLNKIENVDIEIIRFWDKHECKIKKWYKVQQRKSDVIISASPEFLLREICNRNGIHNLIASQVDKLTGKYIGKNCYGEEKVKRFYEKFPDKHIKNFYSDSKSDFPMTKISEKSFLVKGNNILKWCER